jgi:hypothetical protein
MVLPTVINPTGEIGGTASPRMMYTFFILQLCQRYFEAMQGYNPSNRETAFNIQAATSALVAFCPNERKREEMWGYYSTELTAKGEMVASIMTVGKLVQYLSEALEFEEKSTGALM